MGRGNVDLVGAHSGRVGEGATEELAGMARLPVVRLQNGIVGGACSPPIDYCERRVDFAGGPIEGRSTTAWLDSVASAPPS